MPKVTFIELPEDVLNQSTLSLTTTGAADGRFTSPYLAHPRRKEFHFPKQLLLTLVALFSLKNLPVNLLAFLLGRASIMGEIAPFGLAFFAAAATASSKDRAAAIGFFSIGGLLSKGNYWEAIIYGLTIVLYWRLSDRLTRIERKSHVIPFFFLGSVLLAGMAISPWRDTSLYGVFLIIMDAVFCLALIYIFQYGMPLVLGRNKSEEKVSEQLICLILMLSIGVAGLNGIVLFGYSLSNIIGSLIIMGLGLTCGAGAGAAIGVAIGLASGLNGTDAASQIAMYSLAGLLGGALREFGKAAVILGFLLGNIIFFFYFGQKVILTGQLAPALFEPAAASAIFLAMPARRLIKLGEERFYTKAQAFSNRNEQPLDTVMDKLNYIAELLGSLGEMVNTASSQEQKEYNAKIKDSQLNEMLSIVGNKVCDPCEHRNDCWDKEFYPIYQSMLEMLALSEDKNLTDKKVPLPIKSYCANKEALVDIINEVVENNQVHWYWQKKLTDCRRVSAEQLKATGSIVANLAKEIKREPRNDLEAAERLKYQARELCCPLNSVEVSGNRDMVSVRVQKTPCQNTKECVNTVLPLTANIMKESMCLEHECGNKSKNKPCHLVMSLAEKYSIELGSASAAKGEGGKLNNAVCGDTFAHLKLGQGKEALILSDGMGSGSPAANESGATIEFLKKLLTAGFDVDIAVKTVNSMLLLRTNPESFATVDMVIIDAYTCETEFLKVGAASSFIKRVREVATIESSGLPAGIIEQIEIEPVKRTLAPGDIIVMVSDGILERGNVHNKESWLVNYLRRLASENPQDIAASILSQAKTLNGDLVTDDMTVVVAKISEREMLH